MIANTIKGNVLALAISLLCTFFSFSQDDISEKYTTKLLQTEFYNLRGTNAVDAAIGTSVINGDLSDPMFEIFMHVGYKRFLFPHFNINIGYNKFNLAYKDIYNEGFMSFDLNFEYLMLPHQKFSPYLFVGGGYNASNYFEDTATKAQAGLGIEYLVTDGFGIKLYSDYNYMFTDELEGVVYGDADDVYWRIGLGVNFYFGGESKKNKTMKGQNTVIGTNPIIPNQNNTKK